MGPLLGHVDSHTEHYEGRCEMSEGQIVAGGLLVAGRDASIVFDPVDEPLHEVAFLVQALAEFARLRAIAAWWNYRLSAAAANRLDQLVGIIALVGNYRPRLMAGQQVASARDIVFLARTQAQFHRLALSIYGEMQLRTEAAARAAEALLLRRFFSGEPAAC